jgi:purine-nucleoside phosphorylase
LRQVTYLIRVLKQLGITPLFLSNTAGGISKTYKKGDLVLLDDHTNLQGSSPLKGLNRFTCGVIFPDMSTPYDMKLNSKLMQEAQELQIHLKKGINVYVFGPQLDTRVQYRFLGIIGADRVDMSMTLEVIVANQLKLPCAAISVITDECDPDHLNLWIVQILLKREVRQIKNGVNYFLP